MPEIYPDEEYMNDLLHERQGPELDEDFDLDIEDEQDPFDLEYDR